MVIGSNSYNCIGSLVVLFPFLPSIPDRRNFIINCRVICRSSILLSSVGNNVLETTTSENRGHGGVGKDLFMISYALVCTVCNTSNTHVSARYEMVCDCLVGFGITGSKNQEDPIPAL